MLHNGKWRLRTLESVRECERAYMNLYNLYEYTMLRNMIIIFYVMFYVLSTSFQVGGTTLA